MEDIKPVHVIVPMKKLASAKSRLMGALSPVKRRELAMEMFQHVLATLMAPARSLIHAVWVVSNDTLVLETATALGARTLYDTSGDLNTALSIARDAATFNASASRLLVIPADVPLMTHQDVLDLVRALQEDIRPGSMVIVPDQHNQGTNALGLTLPTPMPFLFGEASFERYLAMARQLGLTTRVYTSPTLAMDVDTMENVNVYMTRRKYGDHWLRRSA
ncbi:MAG: 2-phospho-L-lactate guanylyltransferase [Chloroflexaceae bacterium]|nr:2-phospho-L-lactate guanylyltransferase [Chloroflexaceae bacterium]